nr:4089_t:CDS:2 [Entrophospora candida]
MEPTFTSPLLGRVILLNSPSHIEWFLKENFENYVKGKAITELRKELFGDGIFNSNGETWKFYRKITNNLFIAKNFREIFCNVFEQETKTVLNILNDTANKDDTIDLQDLFFRFTLDTFGKISFGIDMKCLEQLDDPLHFAIAFDYVQQFVSQRKENPLWRFTEIFSERGKRIRKEVKYLDEFAYNIIKERKSKNFNDSASSSDVPNDLLKLFMDARKDDGETLTDKELRDMVINMMIAGRDTTANALTWMMYSLMTNPSVEDSLIKELNQFLPPEENKMPTFDNIKKFHYAEATFYETLRLYPSVPKIFRMCVKHDILPDGTHVYPGEFVLWSPWSMGRDERIWGENALQFYPDRFLNSKGVSKPSQFKFPAFHAGQQFATVEALILVTSMLKKFRFELIPGQESPPPYIPTITLPMKNPLLVKVYHRNS